ncbi:hypothetical protein KFK09_015344 [Dendrobium nobile]|uniref:Uncharacterized protein n=1 Tax=Dendrobium nobile TaxID=94219 RepID=A0A8T3B5Q8_DENNO|nr:hypothetical protein KFK09_015344 [Dendrobium nobile]
MLLHTFAAAAAAVAVCDVSAYAATIACCRAAASVAKLLLPLSVAGTRVFYFPVTLFFFSCQQGEAVRTLIALAMATDTLEF